MPICSHHRISLSGLRVDKSGASCVAGRMDAGITNECIHLSNHDSCNCCRCTSVFFTEITEMSGKIYDVSSALHGVILYISDGDPISRTSTDDILLQ